MLIKGSTLQLPIPQGLTVSINPNVAAGPQGVAPSIVITVDVRMSLQLYRKAIFRNTSGKKPPVFAIQGFFSAVVPCFYMLGLSSH